ncbi:MAG TPA: outer membrane beta-barrel protein, partial [Elusimicrobiota bacterium]|nr:outer membrane beta-barrel protein [Elusimicrobiota bacterium]
MFTHPKRRIGNRLVLAALSAVLALSGQVAAEGPAFSGFIDFGYNYNFNGRTINTLRGFDANANSLTLQNAELVAEGRSQSNVGYRVDVDYGYDASLIHSAGFTSTGNGTLQTDIQQAYITVPCPLTRGTVTVGKFVTQHGAEVIEAKDDYNITRGFLFTYVIPYTH